METILRIEETVMVEGSPSVLEVDLAHYETDRSAGHVILSVCDVWDAVLMALTLSQQRLLAEKLLENVAKHEPKSEPVAAQAMPDPSAPASPAIMAYEDLPPGSELRPGDEWKNASGRWVEYNNEYISRTAAVKDGILSRRPHNITSLMRLNEDLNHELSVLRPQLGAAVSEGTKLRQELAAAEWLNAEAEKAGPIVDERIRDFERQLAVANARRREQFAELEELRRALAAERESSVVTTGLVATEQPEESELERRAWEMHSHILGLTAAESFYQAGQWMALRDQRRKAGAA